MTFQDSIQPFNIPAHIDIDAGVDKVKNGLYHFEVRVQKGQIIDYVMREYVEYHKIEQTKSTPARNS